MKTIYGFGDSLVDGHCMGIGMLDGLARKYGMKYTKYAKNGATVIPDISHYFEKTQETGCASPGQDCFGVPDIAAQIEMASEQVPDFICFDGLTNDACNFVTEQYLGKLAADYGGNYDISSFYGAFERICYLLRTKYQESHVFYVCVHKMPTRDLQVQEILQGAAWKACEKWSIPCVDVYREGLINTCLEGMRKAYSYNSAEKTTDGNGTHLNAEGYEKWYLPMIEEKMKKYL